MVDEPERGKAVPRRDAGAGPGLDALEAALREGRLSEETVLDLRLVAEEILTNVAKHGHDDEAEHWVRVRLTLAPDEVTLEFTDDGRPFDPLAAGHARPRAERRATRRRARHRPGAGPRRCRRVRPPWASENVLTLTKRVGGPDGDVP